MVSTRPYQMTWLAEVLKHAGLKVEEVSGWQYRGHGDMGIPQGILLHHTAGSSHGNMPSLDEVTRGRSDLKGPLCNLALGRDGTFYVVAAGTAWHAGLGGPYREIRQNDGNKHLIGIEAENTGYTQGPRAEEWPKVQIDAYKKGVAALLKYIKQPAIMAVGHKEWAPKRKVDPTFDMNKFRLDISKLLTQESSVWQT